LLLQQVKKNPKKPVANAITPMPSKIPNEAFLKTSGLAWVTLSTIY
jgi:hypothetical protein